ncbi:ATP-dependent RNA helicase dbp3 [Limtongia smithiae]|uniref:ATP-dependent RNA helicase dbp3 n=1 Tax=Limtongia smithiae TaxID=1125753 RepID=UPI0034CF498D
MTTDDVEKKAKKHRRDETEDERRERKRLKKLERKRKADEAEGAVEFEHEDEPVSVPESNAEQVGASEEPKKHKKKKHSKHAGVSPPAAIETVATDKREPPAVMAPTVTPLSSQTEIDEFLKSNDISITDPLEQGIKPTLSFAELHVDSRIRTVLQKYPKPTPIQSASWPFLLAGRDVIGVAETGSGKTMAFAVPAISHLLSSGSKARQSKSKHASVLVISPTRELAIQIEDNMRNLNAAVKVKSVCVYGGVSKDDQKRELKNADIIVATPGRLLDLVNDGCIDLSAISYIVLDEADRMLEKGFEEDIKRVMRDSDASVRKTVMFTATWPTSVRDLAAQFLNSPVKVVIGDRESDLKANSRITQIVEVMDPRGKEQRLLQVLKENQSGANKNDKILIFALYKKEAVRVERFLQGRGYNVAAIHGDLSQVQRSSALESFKSGRCTLLLATDVAARGLDIPAVKLVINLTFPLTAEDYVHRIGRTGRAGQTGKAITFFTEHEKHLSGALINVLRAADQPVPPELLKFGGHTKKKEHSAYGAFFKEIDPTKKAKKIVFD